MGLSRRAAIMAKIKEGLGSEQRSAIALEAAQAASPPPRRADHPHVWSVGTGERGGERYRGKVGYKVLRVCVCEKHIEHVIGRPIICFFFFVSSLLKRLFCAQPYTVM